MFHHSGQTRRPCLRIEDVVRLNDSTTIKITAGLDCRRNLTVAEVGRRWMGLDTKFLSNCLRFLRVKFIQPSNCTTDMT